MIHWPFLSATKALAVAAYCIHGPCAVEQPPCTPEICRTEHGRTYLPNGGVIALARLNRDVDWQRIPPPRDVKATGWFGKATGAETVGLWEEGRPYSDCKGSVAMKAEMLHRMGVAWDRMEAWGMLGSPGHMVLRVDGVILDSNSLYPEKPGSYAADVVWPAQVIARWAMLDPAHYRSRPVTAAVVQ